MRFMLEGWKVHVNVMRHNGRGPRGRGGITTLGAWRTISEDANCLPQLSLFNKASTCASSVWHLLASTPLGCEFEAIDFKIDFILFFHACDRLHPVITLVAVLLVEKGGDAQPRV